MFYETHLGYVGLGATEVLRTAQQAATDISTYGRETGEMATQGGLTTMENVFKYSVAKGRLVDLQKEVIATEGRINSLQEQAKSVANELEKLGVAGAMDYVKMGAKAVVSYFLPIFSVLSFAGVDMFGGGSRKKKKAEALITKLEGLMPQLQYWSGRLDLLNAEGKQLSTAFETGGSSIKTSLIQIPQKEVTTTNFAIQGNRPHGLVTSFTKTKSIVDVKDSVFQTTQELESRKTSGPTGARLPVGFQQIYSPVLESGPIVTQVANKTAAGEPIVPLTGKQLVYGGLAGVDDTLMNTGMVIGIGIALWLFVKNK